jgi:hypothetical protein
MDATQIEALKAKFPGVELIQMSSTSATVVARVTKAEVDLFRDLYAQAGTKGRAMERFVRACIVHPGPDELLGIITKKPGLIEKWGDELMDAAGADEEVEAKKL